MGAPVSDQTAYRFRYDDGGEAGASWIAVINTDISYDVDTILRLRIQVSETAEPGSAQPTSERLSVCWATVEDRRNPA